MVGFLKLGLILKLIKEQNIDINIKIVPKNGAEARKNIPRLKKIKPYLKIIFSSFKLSWQIIFSQFFGLETLFKDFSIFYFYNPCEIIK